MSVIMTLELPGDPKGLEEFANANRDKMQAVLDAAKRHGLIAHRFYGADGQIMVVDEWPDPESFQRFFAAEQDTIGPMMEQVATSEPEIIFWNKLETGDDVGWG